MTEEAAKKIAAMYDRFGVCGKENAICRDCSNLKSYKASRTYYKCRIYGESNSEATDWRIGWTACAMFNQNCVGIRTVMEERKRNPRRKPEGQLPGQLTLDLIQERMEENEGGM